MSAFKWRHFAGEVILWAVRWSCRYGISQFSTTLTDVIPTLGFQLMRTARATIKGSR
jgi:hypothetical protein